MTIIYSVWHFGNEIIFKRQPSLITTTYNDEDPLRINITDSNFAIALGLQNPYKANYIDERIYTVNAIQTIMRRVEDGKQSFEKKRVKMIPCNKKEFKLLPDYFKLMDLKNLYCIENTDLFLQGDFGKEVWAYFEFSFNRCKNSTSNNFTCKSEEVIRSSLDGGYFGIFVSDTTIEASNFLSPAKLFGRNIFTTFSLRAFREFWIYLKTIDVSSDSGWLLEERSNEQYFSIDDIREYWDFRNTTEEFFNFGLRCSSSRQVFGRSYLKLQNLAANIGGIVKFLLICGQLLTYIFRQIKYREFLISTFFSNNIEIRINNMPDNSN